MLFVIWKLDLEFLFNSSFGSIKPCPLLLMRMFHNIQSPNKIIVIKDMTGLSCPCIQPFLCEKEEVFIY